MHHKNHDPSDTARHARVAVLAALIVMLCGVWAAAHYGRVFPCWFIVGRVVDSAGRPEHRALHLMIVRPEGVLNCR
jgi:hypothetical protein